MYGFKSLEEVLEEIGAPQLTDGKLRPTTCIHLHKIIYDPVTKQQKLVINNDYISDDESNSLKLFHSMLDRSSMYT